MKNKKLIFIAIGADIIFAAGYLIWKNNSAPGQYDAFAQCIKDSGAKFYGTFWCSHCQNQKEAFGKSAKYLPYIECSTRDGQGQLQVCTDANIEGYPTWEFPDSTRLSGEIPFEILAEKPGCQLTQ